MKPVERFDLSTLENHEEQTEKQGVLFLRGAQGQQFSIVYSFV